MAIKKSELYSSLYQACDNLRGGMDPSQYKNYILTLLFVKYVTDKFRDDPFGDVTVPVDGNFDTFAALRGNKDIGQGMDVALQKLAEANSKLTDIFKEVHFNDPTKLGNGKEMVDKLTNLVNIFMRSEFDFKNNKASGDDILGDAYEYLMRMFAVDSGKSKGQFYTPGEASRVLAGVLGIDQIKARPDGWSIYDPACGSGSLLIRAADLAPIPNVAIFGQELDVMTSGLAKMNLVLHNRATGDIRQGNTFSDPKFFVPNTNDQVLQTFDFAVVNPPFSLKAWTNGLKAFGRFDGYETLPPEKNGDYAWLMHILKSLKSTGRAAVILPLGVLFRGNAEGVIRKEIVARGYIEGIIALPANIFYGTSIPACVIVLDKAGARARTGIFMIDGSRDFIKDGNKNRLRERDIYKIVSTYVAREEIAHYSRFVSNGEIRENDFNLNIPRYIDSGSREDKQAIEAHLKGGVPSADVEALENYWRHFPELKDALFEPFRPGAYAMKVKREEIRKTILTSASFNAYAKQVDGAFNTWATRFDALLRGISAQTNAKTFVEAPAKGILEAFAPLDLIDKYDAYEALLSYWTTVMNDDVYLLTDGGFAAGREIDEIVEEKYNKKKKETTKRVIGWEGRLIPRELVAAEFFAPELKAIEKAKSEAEVAEAALEAYLEEHSGEDAEIDEKELAQKEKAKKSAAKNLKELEAALEAKVRGKYPKLTDEELKTLIVERKWKAELKKRIAANFAAVSNHLAERVLELAERYTDTLEALEARADGLSARLKENLRSMGYDY